MGKTLKTKCAEHLKSFEGNITGQDKADACTELGVGRITLYNYLKGEVANVDTAISIIKFLTKRILDREKELAGLARTG